MTTTINTPRPLFEITDMAALHATLHAAMYTPSGMPDAAMNALFDAHAAVVKELALTPSSDLQDVHAKETAKAIMTNNEEAEVWEREINSLSQSIAADNARLGPSFLMAAE